jgi:glucose/arabinose dehydrogenase
MRTRLALVMALAGLVALAACQPVKPPPSPPSPNPPPSPPSLNPPPPDQPAPPGSPNLGSPDFAFVTGLSNPWDIAFAPNGSMFFTERHGPVSVKSGAAAPVELFAAPPGSAPSGEGGVMGIAVDPTFATNSFIYVCYTHTSDNRVVRFTVGTDPLASATPIVTGLPKTTNIHNGCRIRFGPDGMLWITTGDAATGTNPQNLTSRGGKVLRVRPNGQPAPGNPALGGDPRIYTYGHRNPQGIAFHPVTNQPYSVEHGPGINDEVNRLSAGGNGGWDPIPGYNQSVPMTDLGKFPQAMIPAWRSGDSFTLAPSGATFLSGSRWGSWQNALLVVFLKDSKARVMFLDPSGNVSFSTEVLGYSTRLRSAVQGPDGSLYITTDVGRGGGEIWKVAPS